MVVALEKEVEAEAVEGGIESRRFISLAWLRLLVKEGMEDKGGTEGVRKEWTGASRSSSDGVSVSEACSCLTFTPTAGIEELVFLDRKSVV